VTAKKITELVNMCITLTDALCSIIF